LFGEREREREREREENKEMRRRKGKKSIPPPLRTTKSGDKTLTRKWKTLLLERRWRVSL
jgi:hypothetical protein